MAEMGHHPCHPYPQAGAPQAAAAQLAGAGAAAPVQPAVTPACLRAALRVMAGRRAGRPSASPSKWEDYNDFYPHDEDEEEQEGLFYKTAVGEDLDTMLEQDYMTEGEDREHHTNDSLFTDDKEPARSKN